jgi:uncharacterized membrane protein HdeD (DUF308 family)
MIRILINNWWLLIIRGLFAVAFGICVFFLQPLLGTLFLQAIALTGLTLLFGLFATVCGLATVAAALRGAQRKRGLGLLLADGIAVTAGGLIVMLTPELTLLTTVRIIAATAFVVGILEVAAGVHLHRHLADEWLLMAGGVVSLIFSAYLIVVAPRDIAAVLNWTGIYAFANGAAMVGLALRLRGLRNSVHTLAAAETAIDRASEHRPTIVRRGA